MAADTDALERRIALLEARLGALTALISATPAGALAITAPGGMSITAGGALAVSAGGNVSLVAGSRMSLASGREITLDSRDLALTATVEFAVESGQQLGLACRDASLAMKKDGTVSLKGNDVTIQASGKLNAKASSDVVIRGSKIVQN